MSDSNQLQEAINATTNYRNYLDTLNCEPIDKTRAYHLSLSDIEALAKLNNTTLDGVRLYLGQHTLSNGESVTRVYMVGTELVNGSSVDVGVEQGNFAESKPCPIDCNISSNLLNP